MRHIILALFALSCATEEPTAPPPFPCERYTKGCTTSGICVNVAKACGCTKVKSYNFGCWRCEDGNILFHPTDGCYYPDLK